MRITKSTRNIFFFMHFLVFLKKKKERLCPDDIGFMATSLVVLMNVTCQRTKKSLISEMPLSFITSWWPVYYFDPLRTLQFSTLTFALRVICNIWSGFLFTKDFNRSWQCSFYVDILDHIRLEKLNMGRFGILFLKMILSIFSTILKIFREHIFGWIYICWVAIH